MFSLFWIAEGSSVAGDLVAVTLAMEQAGSDWCGIQRGTVLGPATGGNRRDTQLTLTLTLSPNPTLPLTMPSTPANFNPKPEPEVTLTLELTLNLTRDIRDGHQRDAAESLCASCWP